MQIISLGLNIVNTTEFKVTKTDFISDHTFIDAECIFWDVSSSYASLPQNETSVPTQYLASIKNKIIKRTEEFSEFFKLGRTLVIFSPFFKDLKIADSETSRYEQINLISTIGINQPIITLAEGRNIGSINKDYAKEYFEKCQNYFMYKFKIENPNGNTLMVIRDTDYVLSQFYKISNGLIIILPLTTFSSVNLLNHTKHFIQSTIKLVEDIKSKYFSKYEIFIPEWALNYKTVNERDLEGEMSKIQQSFDALEKESENKKEILKSITEIKTLFCGDGDSLVDVISKVLKEVGFNVENPNSNRDDLIIKYDDTVAVVEIKGVVKSAAEKHAAQLEKWVTTYLVENEIHPKGILIVNTFKETPIEDRSGESFPDQMLSFSNMRNHCLITGLQLYCMYQSFLNSKLTAEEFRKSILNTVGEVIYTENPLDSFV